MHFTDVYEELMELQEVAQQAGYTANMAESTNVHIIEALSQLYAATKEDRSIMSNITTTNNQLIECVDNLITKLNAKNEEIRALQCSIDNLTNTIRSFTMSNMVYPQPVFNPNIMHTPMQIQPAFHQKQLQPPQTFNTNGFLLQQQQSNSNSGTYNVTKGEDCNRTQG
eukprot:9092972-Ditylum_brightwellii.AAC.1